MIRSIAALPRGLCVAVLAGLCAALTALPAAGKLCGDDVGGSDIPCACGDVVVSDVVLGADPVTTEVCPYDGLVLRAPDARRGLTIDLHGHVLRGSGRGAALRVVDGGPGGARVVSSGGAARLEGFEDGIVGRGVDTVVLIEDVVIAASRRDGIRVSTDEFEIRRVTVRDAGRDGFALGGRGFRISATQAVSSHRFGYFVMGVSGTIGLTDGAVLAEDSGDAGFNVMGVGHALTNCAALDGAKTGLHLQAAQLDVRACQARDNAGDGIFGIGDGWRLANNLAMDNHGNGITVRGHGLADAGGNRGERNGAGDTVRPPVQCAISGAPCSL